MMFECIQENVGPLLGSIRAYVVRMGLASGETALDIANEVLQETVVEALVHAEHYQATSHPMAWLRGIALNVIRRKRAVRTRREVSLTLLAEHSPNIESEQELLEQWGHTTEGGPEQDFESHEQAEELLALVSSEDQQVLTLALLEGSSQEHWRSALVRLLAPHVCVYIAHSAGCGRPGLSMPRNRQGGDHLE